jgi:hypothetical protein
MLPDFAFARILMRDFAQRHYPLEKGSSVYGHLTKVRNLHTISSAIKEEKLDRCIFTRLLVEKGFAKRSDRTNQILQIKPIRPRDVVRFKQEEKEWVNMSEALEILGVQKHLFFRFVKSGVFTTIYGGLKTNPYYRKGELLNFNQGVGSRVQHITEKSPDDISLGEVCRRYTIGTEAIYHKLVSGEIKEASVLIKDPRITDVLFSCKELDVLLGPISSSGPTVKEVAERLFLDPSSIAYLIQQKVLIVTHEINLGGAAVKKYICPNSIAAFDQEYVSLKQASFEANVHPATFSKRVRVSGAKYVFFKKYASKIMRRSDIQTNKSAWK